MNKYNTTGIVLKSLNYKDADKMYTILTLEHGKITAMARGVRKISSRRAGNLDSFNLVRLKISENDKGYKNIDEVSTTNSFRYLKDSQEKSVKAYYIGELVYRTIEEGMEMEQTFKLLKKILELLDKSSLSPKVLVAFFEVVFLKQLGYMIDISRPTINLLLKGDIKNLTDSDIDAVDSIIKSYIHEHLSPKLKSLEIL